MEINFEMKPCTCLETVRKRQIMEKTQELRLGEEFPDAGKILGCWGQTMVRSKESRGGEIGINGGVLISVLYTPDGGGNPCTVSSWVPFTAHWDTDIPEKEGSIQCRCNIQSVDARSISARKLILRSSICVQISYYYQNDFPVYCPEHVPENIQMLKRSYPVQLPKEVGEKSFEIEEELDHLAQDFYKLVYCTLHPQILEKKIMTDKLLFRGISHLHFLYINENGILKNSDLDIPFSQYQELTGVYEADAEASVSLTLTGLELEKSQEGSLQLNAGVVGEYTIYNRENISLVEDSYGIRAKVQCVKEENKIPAILDEREYLIPVRLNTELEASECLDAVFYPEQVSISGEDDVILHCYGSCLVLYKDLEGNLQSAWIRWESSEAVHANPECIIFGYIIYNGELHCELSGTTISIEGKLSIHTSAQASYGLTAVKSIMADEKLASIDPNRPSLIIRSAGTEDLWYIAKAAGSTVEAISKINGLEGAVNPEQLLLIPLL